MVNVIDLASRMGRLMGSVEARRAQQQDARRAAWDRVKAECPEHAAMISEFSRIFGKPERVIVRRKGEVILDSRNRGGNGY